MSKCPETGCKHASAFTQEGCSRWPCPMRKSQTVREREDRDTIRFPNTNDVAFNRTGRINPTTKD